MLSLVAAHLLLLGAQHACSRLDDDAARLACYDRTFQRPKPAGSVRWRVERNVSPIDDSETVSVFAEAETAVDGVVGTFKPGVGFICSKGELQAALVLGRTDSGAQTLVATRLDKEPATEWAWDNSTTGDAVLLPRSQNGMVIAFIYQLATHSKLTIQFTPYRSGPLTTTFPLAGLEKQVGALKTACPAWEGETYDETSAKAKTWWDGLRTEDPAQGGVRPK